MTDNTDEEHLNNSENLQFEKSSDENDTIQETETVNQLEEIENMEVHHHSHPHGKKNWKSYVWEFSMLFLAVFCGFLAEYQLEHTIEHNREKEFIQSMIEDAQTDTANIHKFIKINRERVFHLDTLSLLFFNYDVLKKNDYHIYVVFRKLLSGSGNMILTERTLSQLKNSGGMRLIRKKTAADIITLYDSYGKELVAQQTAISDGWKETIEHAYELFNYSYYNPGIYQGVSLSSVLLSHDKLKLIHFGNRITGGGARLTNYTIRLQRMDDAAVKLISTLRKEYHLGR